MQIYLDLYMNIEVSTCFVSLYICMHAHVQAYSRLVGVLFCASTSCIIIWGNHGMSMSWDSHAWERGSTSWFVNDGNAAGFRIEATHSNWAGFFRRLAFQMDVLVSILRWNEHLRLDGTTGSFSVPSQLSPWLLSHDLDIVLRQSI